VVATPEKFRKVIKMKTNNNGRHDPKLIYASNDGILFQGDSLLMLGQMAPDSIDLVFADPPFNLGKDYGTTAFSDELETETYRSWCQMWLLELIRVLKPGGSLFLYHWPKWLIDLGAWMNQLPVLDYRSWIAMKMKGGFPIRNRLHPAHYGILYYTKRGGKHTFNVVRHKVARCRHCGKEIPDYGGYRHKFKKYEDENQVPWIQISDFWEDTRPARQEKSRQIQVVELPLHIPERTILMASNPGDVVLDVFGGSGSTYHAAQLQGRRWIGCDISDVTPILRRFKTTFGLHQICNVEDVWGKYYRADFITREEEAFAIENRIERINETEPFEETPRSFHVYASKSRVLGM
jgi:site-specific DNA-methyltransferase (adenine-specific)